ncbi:hypothetical protein ACWF7H_17150 [Peribacillus butanolivorans]
MKTANLAFEDELEVEFKSEEIIIRKNKNVKLPKGVDAEFMKCYQMLLKNMTKHSRDWWIDNMTLDIIYLSTNQIIAIKAIQIKVYFPNGVVT